MSRRALGFGLMAGLAAISLSCGPGNTPPREAGDTPSEEQDTVFLTLYCGAGIRPAADALIAAFEAEHPARIRPTYAGSEMLLAQIDAARRGDLFMPGAAAYVDRAVEMGLADAATRRAVAYFVPVIFVRKGNPKGIRTLDDFGREGLRIGIGDERSCAIGRQTFKVLEKNRIPHTLIEGNVHFKSATVNELPLQVQLGNLDAVVTWDANARHYLDDGDIVAIPSERNVPSTVPIIRLASSQAPDAAQAFIEFVTSEQGKAILRAERYTVELPETESQQPAGE